VNAEPQRAHPVNFGGIQVAPPWAIAAPAPLYAIAFSRPIAKTQNRTLLPPCGRETGLREDLDEERREGKSLTADSSSRPY
jgi:hypothetical protein